MKNLFLGMKRFVNDEEGVTVMEYALIAALISVIAIVAITLVGTRVNAAFVQVAAALAAPA